MAKCKSTSCKRSLPGKGLQCCSGLGKRIVRFGWMCTGLGREEMTSWFGGMNANGVRERLRSCEVGFVRIRDGLELGLYEIGRLLYRKMKWQQGSLLMKTETVGPEGEG